MDRFLIRCEEKNDSPLEGSTSTTLTLPEKKQQSKPVMSTNENNCDISELRNYRNANGAEDNNEIEINIDLPDDNKSAPVEKKLKTKRKYNQKFRDVWKEQYPWIKHQNGKSYCSVRCLPVPPNKSHLDRHSESLRHKNLEKTLRN